MKTIIVDGNTEKCGKCGTLVIYAEGTGDVFIGGSESYENWRIIKHKFCPECGEKVESQHTESDQ